MVRFQPRVRKWLLACFGEAIAGDRQERTHRFLEEAIELAQAQGCARSAAHQIVEYVFNRPIGDPRQEVGGVMVCLAALCDAAGIDMEDAATIELGRVWEHIDRIRAKQNAKPNFWPLAREME